MLAADGLFIGTAGNVSVRDGDRVAVTGTGRRARPLHGGDVTVVSLDGDGARGLAGPDVGARPPPRVYADTDGPAVVHTHAPYSHRGRAASLDELPVLHYQQLLLGGAVRVAPYATFGTPALAAHVRGGAASRAGRPR